MDTICNDETENYNFSEHPSVCRLSVFCKTFVRPTQAIEIFGNVSKPFGTLATH